MNSNDESEDSDNRKEDPVEKVGYCRPPRQHQWRAGTSGNPKGRPKGVQNEATLLLNILRRGIVLQDSGKRKKVPIMEAMLLKITQAALRGDTKAAAFLFGRLAANGAKFEAPELPRDTAKMTAKELLVELKNRNRG
jgi:hypothetical protein